MEPQEAFTLLQTSGWKYVDCRTKEEFNAGHVEDSVNIPVVTFSDMGMVPNPKFVEELNAAVPDKSTKIIMGCKSGQRSIMASQLALKDQYDEVHNLTGGIMQWANLGLPIKE
jgi:rhodanese-related sulfurtransferase